MDWLIILKVFLASANGNAFLALNKNEMLLLTFTLELRAKEDKVTSEQHVTKQLHEQVIEGIEWF